MKLGIVFDEEDTAKLIELTWMYEVDAYNILASAIDTMYNYWQKENANG